MKSSYKFIVFIRNTEYPSSDFFKLVVTLDDLDLAREFFAFNGTYVYPGDLVPFITSRQLARFKAFYNKPRHYDLFVLTISSYRYVL